MEGSHGSDPDEDAARRDGEGTAQAPWLHKMVREGDRRRSAVLHRGRDDALRVAHRRYRSHRAALRELRDLEPEAHAILKEIAVHHRMALPEGGE